jgi:hypothetical protein
MKSFATLMLCLCAMLAADVQSADSSNDRRFALLRSLTLVDKDLPPGCSVTKGKPPIKGTQNRSITTDPQTFVFVDEELTKMFRPDLHAMYYAVYREAGELGIFGWTFATEDAARKAHDQLRKKHGDRFKLWLSKKEVVCLWRDIGTTDKCFQHFTDYVQKRVDEAKTLPE